MSGKRAAIRYAKAILSLAQDKNEVEAVNNDMRLIASTVSQSQDLADVLNSAVVKITEKKQALLKIFPDVTTITKELFNVLTVNKRLNLLDGVAQSYEELYQAQSGKESAIVTTAFPITAELEQKVLEKAKQFTTKTVQITNIIDEDILGGFILRIGDLQYNASVANKLNRLKREFTLN